MLRGLMLCQVTGDTGFFQKLAREAERWWMTVSLLEEKRIDSSVMTCSHFKEVFFERYFPTSVRDEMTDEFLSLTQGTSTVQSCVVRYIELSHFASCMILNKYEKAWRFKKGLRKDIRRLVGMLQIQEFPVLVDKVVVVDAGLQEDGVVQEHKKKTVPSGSQTGSRQG
ncbi:uncharacterized protein LOC131145723 [Malania oleifera]|uniref:uncharacterized protein LOC131145723 n=1 Tax=Malania oleifera TaxID=397392 RepID=UPI0025AE4FF9|nr:uncharacterized protein LOC131145723 [Malania oleifera]